jgi:hypothetical protein
MQSRACGERVYDATPCPPPKGRATFRAGCFSRVAASADSQTVETKTARGDAACDWRQPSGSAAGHMQPTAPDAVRVLRASTAEHARDREERASRAEVPRQLRERCSRVSGSADGAACARARTYRSCNLQKAALVFSRLHARASRPEVGTIARRSGPDACLSVLLIAELSPTTDTSHSHRPHNVSASKLTSRPHVRAANRRAACRRKRRDAVQTAMTEVLQHRWRRIAACQLHWQVGRLVPINRRFPYICASQQLRVADARKVRFAGAGP